MQVCVGGKGEGEEGGVYHMAQRRHREVQVDTEKVRHTERQTTRMPVR